MLTSNPTLYELSNAWFLDLSFLNVKILGDFFLMSEGQIALSFELDIAGLIS